MIGLGKWKYHVATVFLTGDVVLSISDVNGEYKIEIQSIEADADIPEFRFYDVAENDNTLTAKGEVSLLPGSLLDLSLTFEGDTMTGYLQVPYVGKIRIKDGKKID